MRFGENFSLISEDRSNELVGGIVIAVFEMAEKLSLSDEVLNRLVDNITKGVQNYQPTKTQPVAEKTNTAFPVEQKSSLRKLSYNDFVGKGKSFFNKHFPNSECDNEEKKRILRSIIEEGWKAKKPTKQIAEEFKINYITFNEKLGMWGIKSYAPQYQGKPYRKIFHRKHKS